MNDAASLERQIQDAERMIGETSTELAGVADGEDASIVEPGAGEVIAPVMQEADEGEIVPHSEKSRLGRKVKHLESTLSEIKDTLDILRDTVSNQVRTQPIHAEEQEPDLPDGATSEEIKQYVKDREEYLLRRLEQKQREKEVETDKKLKEYAKVYAKFVSDIDLEEEGEIYKMLTDTKDLTYNCIHTGDPREDFLINYRAASKAVIAKTRTGAPKITVANKSGQIPSGVILPSTTTKQVAKKIDMSKWSKDERELASLFSEDELASMVS
jgi:hypothetical protein